MRTLTFIIALAACVGGCTLYWQDGDDDPRGGRPDADYRSDAEPIPEPDAYEPGDPWPDGGGDPWPDAAPPDDGGGCGTPDAAPYVPDGAPGVDAGHPY